MIKRSSAFIAIALFSGTAFSAAAGIAKLATDPGSIVGVDAVAVPETVNMIFTL